MVDGLGNRSFAVDLGIANGKISAVGRIGEGAEAALSVNARGKVVCPGFIDIHSHADFVLLAGYDGKADLLQGVTTLYVGSCGSSPAPCSNATIDLLQAYAAPIHGGHELDWSWRTYGDYLARLRSVAPAVNVATQVGHGVIRIAVMGFDNRPPTDDDLTAMKKLVEEAMLSGAFGMSTGLVYPPGIYSRADEIAELLKVVAQYGGIHTSHVRGESDDLVKAVTEAISTAGKADLPVHLSHHKAMGRANWGKVKHTLAMVDDACDNGQDITLDQYPYEACSTLLSAMVPPWAMAGGFGRSVERLKDPEERARIRAGIEEDHEGWENFVQGAGGWHGVMLSFLEKNKRFEGKLVREVAEDQCIDPYDVFFDLVVDEAANGAVVCFSMSEEDVRAIMKHPRMMVGSDGIPSKGKPHPRMYGTFARVLGRYVRDLGVIGLEEAIHKMTGAPAGRLGLTDRGALMPGNWADVVVFDPGRIIDTATYTDPIQYAEGIEWVFVNGEAAVSDGELTGVRKGMVLTHQY